MTNPFVDYASQWWDRTGPFRTLHDINPTRLAFISRHVDLLGKSVLDLGCGGGILSEALAREGACVTGVDIEHSLIQVARAHAQNAGLNIDYHASAIQAFQEKKFDVIVCMEMLEHVNEPQLIIEECAKRLAPGGLMFLSTINRSLKAYLELVVMGEYVLRLLPRQTHDYRLFIQPSEMREYLQHAGLKLQDIAGMSYQPFSGEARLIQSVAVNYLMCAKQV
jgi:2-polyprenyl-6-hydroxyphenyl methylase/3-demethylubiquinone-9 3-methyltransferase